MLFDLKRYPFAAHTVHEAPAAPGVWVLWEGNEPTWIGVARAPGATIRSCLSDRLDGGDASAREATHYSWRLSLEPTALARELMRECTERLRKTPRCNDADLESA
jgi:hypothetical protein